MFKVVIGYPSVHEEIEVVERMSAEKLPRAELVIEARDLLELQKVADTVYVAPRVMEYAVALATATRDLGSVGLAEMRRYVSFGASPRAPLNLVLGAKALAVLRGREYALPDDVRDLAYEVLRHRFVLSYEALAEEVGPDRIIEKILERTPLPRVHIGDPHGDARADLEAPRV
jgi:MoxR-like ATPase